MGTTLFIISVIIIILAFAIFGEDLVGAVLKFLAYFIGISSGVLIVGGLLCLFYMILISIFGK